MLGHIAIATLGGYYAQDTDTGAVVDTYVPAAHVRVKGPHPVSYTIDASDAVFEKVFDETFVYAKSEFLMPTSAVTHPALARVGTLSANYGARTFWQAGATNTTRPTYFCLIINENYQRCANYVPGDGPISVWTKRKSRQVVFTHGESQYRGTPVLYDSFRQLSTYLATGVTNTYADEEFYVASLVNDYYGVAWLLSPMLSLQTGAVALFEHFNTTLQEI